MARTVLEARYLRQDETGAVVETPRELFRRVAGSFAAAEGRFDAGPAPETVEAAFFEAVTALDFLANSPTLTNAGTEPGQLAACDVLPVGDSLESVFDAIKHTALVHQSGGGTGFAFSRLRPQGDVVEKTGGVASSPVVVPGALPALTPVSPSSAAIEGPAVPAPRKRDAPFLGRAW